MIIINIINGVKEREFTPKELETQIATVSTASKVVLFQQGDETKYSSYQEGLANLQSEYVTNIDTLINTLALN